MKCSKCYRTATAEDDDGNLFCAWHIPEEDE